MRAPLDNTDPLAYGMPETVDVFFDNNPVFRLPAEAKANGQTPVAWFAGKDTLDSGWAQGQQLLDGGHRRHRCQSWRRQGLRDGTGSDVPRRTGRHVQAAF
ncbi:MAG: hypothetical protein WDO73_00950 [Ignavibacteriota bacterium]